MHASMTAWHELAGGVLLHSALPCGLGSSSPIGQCSGQSVQQAQASARLHSHQHTGSSLLSVARMVAMHDGQSTYQQAVASDHAKTGRQMSDPLQVPSRCKVCTVCDTSHKAVSCWLVQLATYFVVCFSVMACESFGNHCPVC